MCKFNRTKILLANVQNDHRLQKKNRSLCCKVLNCVLYLFGIPLLECLFDSKFVPVIPLPYLRIRSITLGFLEIST